jgi:hypothetical protein
LNRLGDPDSSFTATLCLLAAVAVFIVFSVLKASLLRAVGLSIFSLLFFGLACYAFYYVALGDSLIFLFQRELQTVSIVTVFYVCFFALAAMLYAVGRARDVFPSSLLSGVLRPVFALLLLSCFVPIFIFCPYDAIPEILRFQYNPSITLMSIILVILHISVLGMAALPFVLIFIKDRNKSVRLNRFALKLGNTAGWALVVFLLFVLIGYLLLILFEGSYTTSFLMVIILTSVLLVLPVLLLTSGIFDITCFLAYKKWSKLVDQEITRMHQEINAI